MSGVSGSQPIPHTSTGAGLSAVGRDSTGASTPQVSWNSALAAEPSPVPASSRIGAFHALHRAPIPDGVAPSEAKTGKQFSAGRCLFHTERQEACFAVRTAAAERALNRLQRENDQLKHTQIDSMREQQRLQQTVKCLKEELVAMGNTIVKQTASIRSFSTDIDRHDPCRLIRMRRQNHEQVEAMKTKLAEAEQEKATLQEQLAAQERFRHREEIDKGEDWASEHHVRAIEELRRFSAALDLLTGAPSSRHSGSTAQQRGEEVYQVHLRVLCCEDLTAEEGGERSALGSGRRRESALNPFVTVKGPMGNVLLETSPQMGTSSPSFTASDGNLCSFKAIRNTTWSVVLQVSSYDYAKGSGSVVAQALIPVNALLSASGACSRERSSSARPSSVLHTTKLFALPLSDERVAGRVCFDVEVQQVTARPTVSREYELNSPYRRDPDRDLPRAERRYRDAEGFAGLLDSTSRRRGGGRAETTMWRPSRTRKFDGEPGSFEGYCPAHMDAELFPPSDSSMDSTPDGANKMVYLQILHADSILRRDTRRRARPFVTVFDNYPEEGMYHQLTPVFTSAVSMETHGDWSLWHEEHCLYRMRNPKGHLVFRVYDEASSHTSSCSEPVFLGEARVPKSEVLGSRLLDNGPAQSYSFPLEPNEEMRDSVTQHFRRHLGSIVLCFFRLPESGTKKATRRVPIMSGDGVHRIGKTAPVLDVALPLSRLNDVELCSVSSLSPRTILEGEPIVSPVQGKASNASIQSASHTREKSQSSAVLSLKASDKAKSKDASISGLVEVKSGSQSNVSVGDQTSVQATPSTELPPPPPPVAEVPPPPSPVAEVPPPPPPVAEVPPPPPPVAEVPPPPPPVAEVPPPPPPVAEVPPPPPPVAEVPPPPPPVAEGGPIPTATWYSLRIHVKEGTGLLQSGDLMDPQDDCDPRVNVWVDESKVLTIPPVHKSSHPVWPTTMGEFVTTVHPGQTLKFEVQDMTFFGEAMGEASILVWDAMQMADGQEVELPVILNKKRHGQLKLHFTYN